MIPTNTSLRVAWRPGLVRSATRAFLMCVLLLMLGLTTAGCAGVQVSQSSVPDEPTADLEYDGPERDLALGGIQIAPDLSRAISMPSGATSFQLLVSVENRGRWVERDVLVEAWLKAPAEQGGMVLMHGSEMASSIASGDLEVVTLTASGVVPMLSSYVLVVSARPSLEEPYLGNNVAEYEITVSATEGPLG